MYRPIMFNNCSNCVHSVTFLGTSGCTHRKGGHKIQNMSKEKCIYFKCEWCNRNRCICKRSDFY